MLNLYKPPSEFLKDPEHGNLWKDMSNKWIEFLKTLTDKEFEDVVLEHIGGQKSSYDFKLNFIKSGSVVDSIPHLEFKHNAKCITQLPQYYQLSEKNRLIPASYAEYFYDTWLDSICDLSPELVKPDRNIYLKNVYATTSKRKLQFLNTLGRLTKLDKQFDQEKTKIVHKSIEQFLLNNWGSISLDKVNEKIQESQQKDNGKVFVMWDKMNFNVGGFKPNELDLIKVVGVINKNTIVIETANGSKHLLTLRWQNTLGCNNISWQFKLRR